MGKSLMHRLGMLLVGTIAMAGCSNGYAHDVAFLSSKHFVVAKWYGGGAITRDGGASWSHAITIPINQLSVGHDGQLWGFHAWGGIHEPSSAALTYSTDGGDSWTTIELDADAVMPTAFMNAAGERPLLLTRTGQIWVLAGEDIDTWRAWHQFGVPNPDGAAGPGLAVGDALYVATKDRVWLSEDHGRTWNSIELPGIVRFAQDAADCWAINSDGVLYKTPRGRNEWDHVVDVPAVRIPFSLAAKKGKVYVTAEGDGWIAYGAMVDSTGKVTPLPGLHGKQAYSVRLDPSGIAWCVADGLHRETDGEWVRTWPNR